MSDLKDSGNRTDMAGTGGLRDIQKGNGRFDLLPFCVIWRLAKHYEAGANKYSDRNWEKGILAHSFVDSACRHITKYMMGWDDEDHLIAAIWNLCGLAWTEENHPELIDIPNRQNAVRPKQEINWDEILNIVAINNVEQEPPKEDDISSKHGEKDLEDDSSPERKKEFHFLSLWDCTKGRPFSEPPKDPFVYKRGDYYVLTYVYYGPGKINLLPATKCYSKKIRFNWVGSCCEDIKEGMFYIYDGNSWVLSSTLSLNEGQILSDDGPRVEKPDEEELFWDDEAIKELNNYDGPDHTDDQYKKSKSLVEKISNMRDKRMVKAILKQHPFVTKIEKKNGCVLYDVEDGLEDDISSKHGEKDYNVGG